MVNIMSMVNKILRSKGNLIKISFTVDGRELEAFVPDDQLWVAIKDILLNREYEYLIDFEFCNFNGTIVDAGAYDGLFSLVASCFAQRIIAVEPHPVNYRLLEINLLKNRCKNVITLNKALVGKQQRKVKIYDGAHTAEHSIMARDNLKSKYQSHYYEVLGITLSEIISKYGSIDLLKIDIEGAEFDVFKNLNKKDLHKIKAIVGEIHLKHGDLRSIIQTLESAGFKVWYFHPPLIKKSNKSAIKLNGIIRLKILRKLVYAITSLGNIKDKELAILFAKRGV